jgi:hypothetical protein
MTMLMRLRKLTDVLMGRQLTSMERERYSFNNAKTASLRSKRLVNPIASQVNLRYINFRLLTWTQHVEEPNTAECSTEGHTSRVATTASIV